MVTAVRQSTGKTGSPKPAPPSDKTDLREKVRQAVIARLGNEVDRNLLDTIITRVLDNVGVRG